jgi:hypothetical protein
MNLIDVAQKFPTDEECLEYIEQMRWPDGKVRCVTCGCDRISRIERKAGIGQPRKNVRKSLYQCLEATCKQQFSATSGTIFNDSHLPLYKWFMALAIVVDAKKSISANQLKEHLGIGSYRTAWYMAHRIRKAMADADPTPLSGVVEIDETYIGGTAIRRFQKTPKVKPPKEMVFPMASARRWSPSSRRTCKRTRTASTPTLRACTTYSSSLSIPKRIAWSITLSSGSCPVRASIPTLLNRHSRS